MNVELISDPSWTVNWLGGTWDFLNSVFVTAVAGSLAGAFFGAWGAQRIAERAKKRDELIKEIRDTNTASVLAFSLCNSLLSVKKQHAKPFKERFETQKAELQDFHKKRQAGEISQDAVFEFVADLRTLSLPQLPVDILQRQIFEKLSLVGRPLVLTTTIGQTLEILSATFERRNQLIESYKKPGQAISAPLYFGLRQGDQLNEDYPSTIHAIYRLTDDGIYFSYLLNQDLVEHGDEVAVHFKKKFGKVAPKVNRSDFSNAEKAGLMPNADNYTDWVTMFKKSADSMGSQRVYSIKVLWTTLQEKCRKLWK